MAKFGWDKEDTHESMHMYRRYRKYKGHKLAMAVGLRKKQRTMRNIRQLRPHKAL